MPKMIPPMSAPPRPSPRVAYQGIGSGPGRAGRASPPATKPITITPMIHMRRRLPAVPRGQPFVHRGHAPLEQRQVALVGVEPRLDARDVLRQPDAVAERDHPVLAALPVQDGHRDR